MTKSIALVTGATSDLGAAISHGLADAGVHVLATGRDRDRLARVMDRPEAGGDKASTIETVSADLTSMTGCSAVRDLVYQHNRLDVLVLGSGIYERSNDPDALMRQFAANVHGPYTVLQALLPLLIAAKGLIVFISSTQGLSASPGVGQFAATQFAMRALADSLRAEIHFRGVRTTTLFLGRTATARQAGIFASEQRPYFPERLIQPEDVAAIVVWLKELPHTSEVTEIAIRPRQKSY